MEGHSGTLNGYLRFQHFKNINYRFEIQANNMLCDEYEGIDGYAILWNGICYREMRCSAGNAIQGLDVNVAMTTNRNTVPSPISTEMWRRLPAPSLSKFVDKTPRRNYSGFHSGKSHITSRCNRSVRRTKKSSTDRYSFEYSRGCYTRCHHANHYGPYSRRLHQCEEVTGNIRTEFYNKGRCENVW